MTTGGSGTRLQAGAKIRDTESGVDLEELVSQFIHGNVK
jgi:phospholipid/cholesterol/gamma-HCH transport system substrate-binding protein